jgi:hypothetical protein
MALFPIGGRAIAITSVIWPIPHAVLSRFWENEQINSFLMICKYFFCILAIPKNDEMA